MTPHLELSRTKLKTTNPQPAGHFGHVHNDYEVYYLLSGEVQYFIKSSAFVLKAGDLVVIPKNIIHKTVYSINQSYERLLINFTQDALKPEDRYLLSELTPLHISLSSEFKQRIQEVLLRLEDEYNSNGFGNSSLLTSYVTELLVFYKQISDCF